jgi:glycosyltransferase involved in cell wall biosynthesis
MRTSTNCARRPGNDWGEVTGLHGSVAIVVPSYNRADLIGETLLSLRRQAAGLADVAAVYLADDCSTDGTVDVALEAWAGSPPLTVTRGARNAGTYGNVNRALKELEAVHEWLLVLHDDDLARPDWLGAMLQRLWTCDATVATISSSWNLLHADGSIDPGEQRGLRPDEIVTGTPATVRGTLLRGCWWHFSGSAIRTSALVAIGPFDPTLPQCADWDWLLRCHEERWDVLYVPESLIDYRQHTGTVSSHSFRVHRDLREQLVLVNRYRSFLEPGDVFGLHARVAKALARRSVSALLTGRPATAAHAVALVPAVVSSLVRRSTPQAGAPPPAPARWPHE